MSTAKEALEMIENLSEQMKESEKIKENIRVNTVKTLRLIEQEVINAIGNNVLPNFPNISPFHKELKAVRVQHRHYEPLPEDGVEVVILNDGTFVIVETNSEEESISIFSIKDEDIDIYLADQILRRYVSTLFAASKYFEKQYIKFEEVESINNKLQFAFGYKI